jgi:hypothetical protein
MTLSPQTNRINLSKEQGNKSEQSDWGGRRHQLYNN